MLSNEPDVKPKKPDIEFIAALAIHSGRRDRALGLQTASNKSLGLLKYYEYLRQQEIKRYARAVYLKTQLEQNEHARQELMALAMEAKTLEERKTAIDLLEQIQQRQVEIVKALENG
jgi:hypothetical protein